ncbi:MAG: hypothetical protein K2Z81_00705 [Cyanobacteria bacterium]|nr:hypothetical protein [Cyanobacteriota bacterium]
MSVVFSLQIPMDELPPPVSFIYDLAKNWVELPSDDSNVFGLYSMGNTVLPICPALQEFGDQEWLYDRSYMFYLSRISTRGLEVWYCDDAFKVRVLTLACPEEWDFAQQILEHAAGGENALVSTDWEPTIFRLGSFGEVFNDSRIEEALALQLHNMVEVIEDNSGTLDLNGPVNSFFLGPWLWQRICSDFEDLSNSYIEVLDVIFSLMRIVNYAGVMPAFDGIVGPVIEKTPMPDGSYRKGALVTPEQRFFIRKVDSLIFQNSKTQRTVLAENFRSELGNFFLDVEELLWLDEHQFIMNPISDERFSEFFRALEKASTKSLFSVIRGRS